MALYRDSPSVAYMDPSAVPILGSDDLPHTHSLGNPSKTPFHYKSRDLLFHGSRGCVFNWRLGKDRENVCQAPITVEE